MKSISLSRPTSRETALGWSAVAATAAAVFAWAACCVLPVALSLAGLSLAGTAVVAGQRTWLTIGAAMVLTIGWWSVSRHRRMCAADASCGPPSRLSISLLSAASVLIVVAFTWQPLVEPRVLMLLRSLHE